MTKSIKVSIPSFATHAAAIMGATAKADQAWVKSSAVTAQHMMQFIDAASVAGVDRTVDNAKAIGAAVRAGFEKFVLMGAIQKSTVSNYATGASRAFFHNVAWEPRTFQDPALALPGGKAKAAKAGTVTTTNNDALVKTLVKALEQCRTIGNDSTAAGIVDLICEIKPDFTEQTAE
jgi:hypothetical protein